MKQFITLLTLLTLLTVAVPAMAQQDSDGDGFPDNVDECPNEPGPVSGCVPTYDRDSDGDGFSDAVDQCPDTPGSFAGCPEFEFQEEVPTLPEEPAEEQNLTGPPPLTTSNSVVFSNTISNAVQVFARCTDGSFCQAGIVDIEGLQPVPGGQTFVDTEGEPYVTVYYLGPFHLDETVNVYQINTYAPDGTLVDDSVLIFVISEESFYLAYN